MLRHWQGASYTIPYNVSWSITSTSAFAPRLHGVAVSLVGKFHAIGGRRGASHACLSYQGSAEELHVTHCSSVEHVAW